MMEWTANILYWVATHKILYFALSFIPLIMSVSVMGAKKKRDGKYGPKTAFFGFFGIFLFAYGIINFIWGSSISSYLVYEYGEKGTGVVTAVRETNIMYNERVVMAYEVLIKTKEGKSVESDFKSMDFNIYPPPERGYSYPSPGVRFSVHYLKSNPRAFVIIGNDDSSYAMDVKCREAFLKLGPAKIKFDADPSNVTYKERYVRVLKNYIETGCEKSDLLRKFYKDEINKLEANR